MDRDNDRDKSIVTPDNGGSLTLPAVIMRDIVVMPDMTVQFEISRERSARAVANALKSDRRVFLTLQKDPTVEEPTFDDCCTVGVVALVKQVVKCDGFSRVLVSGLNKAYLQKLFVDSTGGSCCECLCVDNYAESRLDKDEETAVVRAAKNLFREYAKLAPNLPGAVSARVSSAKSLVEVFESIALNVPLQTEDRQLLLEIAGADEKLIKLTMILAREIKLLGLEKDIQQHVAEQFDYAQKLQYLRQMKIAVNRELGEATDDFERNYEEDDGYMDSILSLGLDEEHESKLLSELSRMRKMPPSSQEAALISEYLDTCLALPWNDRSRETYSCSKARSILDKDHYGLKKVKERIIENIAVRQLSPQVKGQIICLVGPPGVGKTSIGRSIAKALGRKYVRVSLGGIRDEADIRGHRKTYIGAMPGRIIDALKKCGVNNPVMLLDEIDKLTSDAHGDPSSALLEALDSEQNSAFRDHYIEMTFDLSNVLFITTANTLDTIQPPLLDRMEVIELSSYTREEKFHIASRHLVPKQLKQNGLKASQVRFAPSAVYAIIDSYTREAGVRKLERAIASLCRKAAAEIVDGKSDRVSFTAKNLSGYLGAPKFLPDRLNKHDCVGEVNGLAWTSVGGVLMPLEAVVLKGKGVIETTGSLGEVMKESAKLAVSYSRSVAGKYGIDPDFYKNCDIHIHAPEGAVPKDGPSAGVTLVTAVISALSNTPVRHDIAMTGEITLTGKVLPIGGLKEKTLAAYKDGIRTVVIPAANSGDLDEIDDSIRSEMDFILAERISDVLDAALVRDVQTAVRNKRQTDNNSSKKRAKKRVSGETAKLPAAAPGSM